MQLHDKRFYSDNFDKDEYRKAQIDRHRAKYYKKREAKHYKECANEITELVTVGDDMICLGTRNNHERDMFEKSLSSKEVKTYSLDISPLSKADYVMDFNELPVEWECKWDILFSNSIDHSVNATETFYRWLDVVKEGGILLLGFDKNSDSFRDTKRISKDSLKNTKDTKRVSVSKVDCSSFDMSNVNDFMKLENDKFEFVKYFENSYRYYVLRKK